MKILQICNKPPFPSVDGGCIAMHQFTKVMLQQHIEVKVLTITTPKHPVLSSELPTDYVEATQFESIFLDTTPNLLQGLKSTLLGHCYLAARFYSKEMAQKITHLMKQEHYDAVQLESIYLAVYIPAIRNYSKAKIVYRAPNVEHQIWEGIVKQEKNFLKKRALHILMRQLKKFEVRMLSQIDAYLAISEPDCQFFKSVAPIGIKGESIYVGIDTNEYLPEEHYIPSDKPELFHIGSMNWIPNIEGLNWFLEEVWPLMNKMYPEVTFTIAGRNIPERLCNTNKPNIMIAGEVPSAADFMRSKDIMIVPLLSGSGVRIKILEGMALGKTIISTTIGAQGLEVEDGKNIFIADTPDEFIEALTKCIKTPDLCDIIGENATEYVALYHNNQLLSERVLHFYQELLG